MGPRFFKRGNASQAFSDTSFDVTLQWGRAFSSAEIPYKIKRKKMNKIASMGPRFFKRGNLFCSGNFLFTIYCFNGAALFQARKYVVDFRCVEHICGLQWGRAFSSAEIHTCSDKLTFLWFASMGPRFFKRGNIFKI